jgi:hypothetical protein
VTTGALSAAFCAGEAQPANTMIIDKVNIRINLPLNNMPLSKHAPKKKPGVAGSF